MLTSSERHGFVERAMFLLFLLYCKKPDAETFIASVVEKCYH